MGKVSGNYGSGYGSGSGDGAGYGAGYGYGAGDGAGDGYGYGYGYGDGYGDGSGYGAGYGDGYGYGSGYGAGYGDGYGYGSGYGAGYGDGSGYGYGYGDGYGDGSGYGAGYGSKDYFQALLLSVTCERGAQLAEQGATLAFWRSSKNGTPANHRGDTKPRNAGMVEEVEGPLQLCSHHALHATLNPDKWRGERLWAVALYPPIAEGDDKLGALKREIICEIPNFLE